MVTQEELENMSPEEVAALQKQNCIFCKIIGGEIPSSKVFENDTTVSILDINPATKGHALVMPKEHYPILPLVPPPTFKQMFLDAKTISTAIKEVTLAGSTAIFIANGALAGQQAPHFLFHIIPDYTFSFPPDYSIKEKNEALGDALKNNLGIMMGNHARREGLSSQPQAPSQLQLQPPSPQELEQRREQIAKIIEENADVRELLRTDVEKFKQTIEQNEQLKEIFFGVDLDALSKNLQQIPTQEVAEETKSSEATSASNEEPQSTHIETQVDAYAKEEENEIADGKETHNMPSSEAITQYAENPNKPKAEVFLGSEPYKQKEIVFAYFDEKPKAKELLMSDVSKFKELLETREDVQPIFKDVDIVKLSQKLNEVEGANE